MKTKRKVDLVASGAEFQAKIDAARVARPVRQPRKVRDDFYVHGFCKHGIPMHCPHGCAK